LPAPLWMEFRNAHIKAPGINASGTLHRQGYPHQCKEIDALLRDLSHENCPGSA
jgi:hypothetical protein